MFDLLRKLSLLICLVLALSSGISSADELDPLAIAQAIEKHYTTIIERASPSVVAVANIEPSRLRRPEEVPFKRQLPIGDMRNLHDPTSPDFIPKQFGAGVVIAHGENSAERSILTNFHLIRGGAPVGATSSTDFNRIFVYFSDHRTAEAQILAADPRSDLAILKLLDNSHIDMAKLPGLALGNATGVKKGNSVVVLGNPYAIARDGSASASRGMVSNLSRFPMSPGSTNDSDAAEKTTIHHFGTLLHIDARLNLGGSGGALLNLKGELIGLTTSLAAIEGYEKSVGFAIPFDQPTRRIILEELCKGYEVEYGFLGIYPDNFSSRDIMRARSPVGQFAAARAVDVAMNSPAKRGGLLRGDLILAINDKKIFGRYGLMREIGLQKPGSVSKLMIYRAGRRQYLYVTLGKWPVLADESIIATKPRPERQWAGLTIDFPTARRKYSPEPLIYPSAIVVLKVAESSPASDAGIEPGDLITHVNKKPVETPNDFAKIIAAAKNSPVDLDFKDGRELTLAP